MIHFLNIYIYISLILKKKFKNSIDTLFIRIIIHSYLIKPPAARNTFRAKCIHAAFLFYLPRKLQSRRRDAIRPGYRTYFVYTEELLLSLRCWAEMG